MPRPKNARSQEKLSTKVERTNDYLITRINRDAFYLGVISAGCRSILSDRERSVPRSSGSKVKRSTSGRHDGTAGNDHRSPASRDRAPLRELAASRPGEPLRVAAELRELPANAAMRLVLHDGNEYL